MEAELCEEEEEEEPSRLAAGISVDGGWSWVVCAAGFLVHFVVSGQISSGGVVYTALMDEFRRPRGETGGSERIYTTSVTYSHNLPPFLGSRRKTRDSNPEHAWFCRLFFLLLLRRCKTSVSETMFLACAMVEFDILQSFVSNVMLPALTATTLVVAQNVLNPIFPCW